MKRIVIIFEEKEDGMITGTKSVANVDDAILAEIVKIAKEKDVTTLVVLNKEYIYEALDKHRPKKVKPFRDYKTIKACPVCGRELIYSAKYCYDCGQRVDWEV